MTLNKKSISKIRLLNLFTIPLVIAFSLICKSQTSYGLSYLAFGDIRGSIEPCGCDPKTDLGGVKRIAKLIDRDRDLYPDTLVFDLGNNYLNDEDLNETRAEFINKALIRMKADASLFNVGEMILLEKGKSSFLNGRKYLISNLTSLAKKRPLDIVSQVHDKKTVVLGFTWSPRLKKTLEPWSTRLKQKFQEIIKRHSSKKKVLLFSGPDDQLQKIIASKLFDEIVSANRNPFKTLLDNKEKKNPGLLLRASNLGGIYMTPIGGQGILRGGQLRKQNPVSLDQLIRSKQSLDAAERQVFASEELVTWLDKSFDADSPLDDLMNSYNKFAANAFLLRAKRRSRQLSSSPYAGSESCKKCHASSYEIWQNSAHAQAYATLQEKMKHQDEKCVSCHVLAYDQIGGFASLEKSPQFANVTCENCHGPRKKHVENPLHDPGVDAADTCVSCHHNPHSPDFDYKKYWKSIEHGLDK